MPKINEAQWSSNRSRIVAIAFELFAQKGYSRVSVNDIIKEAKISKGGFYTYFASKQDIFFAIVENSDIAKSMLAPKIDLNLSPAERIAEYIRVRMNYFFEDENIKWIKFSSEFWSTVALTEEMKQLNEKRYHFFSEDIKSIITDGIEKGHFRADLDLDALLYVIISLIDGVASMAAVMQNPLDPRKIKVATEMIVTYLKGGL